MSDADISIIAFVFGFYIASIMANGTFNRRLNQIEEKLNQILKTNVTQQTIDKIESN